MLPNPYTPGAGLVPGYLAGREEMLKTAAESIAALAQGYPTRSLVYYGLRGVGKTVLVNKIEKIAEASNVLYEHMEVSERSSFKAAIAFHVQKLMQQTSTKEQAKSFLHKTFAVLKAFQITYSPEGEIGFGLKDEIEAAVGVSDTGNFQNDLTELFVALGALARQNEQAVCLFIDEIQYLKEEEFEALIAAIHRCNQKGLPLALFGAGLPKVTKMAGAVKSYAERLFYFVSVESLPEQEAELALTEPAKALGVSYTKDALQAILRKTQGYPYFIQEYGKQVWEAAAGKEIDCFAVEAAYGAFEKGIDESFFKVRYDRATAREKAFMLAMAKCETLPCTVRQVAEYLKSDAKRLASVRSQLIQKGFIYAAGYGEVDFSVPQFREYLARRQTTLAQKR